MGTRIFLILFLGLPLFGTSQTLLSSDAVLAGAQLDLAFQLRQQQTGIVRDNSPRLPLLESIDLRTESDRFELQRQEYLARFSLNGLSRIHQEKVVQESTVDLAFTDERIALHKALKERYELLLSNYLLEREILLHTSLRQVYRDKITVLDRMVALNNDADVEESIRTEYDSDVTEARLLELEQKYKMARLTLQQQAGLADNNWTLDTSNLMAAQELLPKIEKLSLGEPEHPDLAKKSARAALAVSELRLENARSRQMLDFVQFRYADKINDPWNYDVSLGIGIKIPYKGSSRIKSAAFAIEENDNLNEYQLLRTQLNIRIFAAETQLSALAERQSRAAQKIADTKAWLTPERIRLMSTDGPLALLRYQELLLKRELLLLNIEQSMYENYLDVLDASGQLSNQPIQNFLKQ